MEVKLLDKNVYLYNTMLAALKKSKAKGNRIKNNGPAFMEFCWFAFELHGISKTTSHELAKHRCFTHISNQNSASLIVADNGKVWFDFLTKILCNERAESERFQIAKQIWIRLIEEIPDVYQALPGAGVH